MKRQTYIGILAFTIVAASFSACTKTVYVPESEYNEMQNEKKSKKKETDVEKNNVNKKGKKDKNKQIISRPGNKGTESTSQNKVLNSGQQQAVQTKSSKPNNIYEVVTVTNSTPANKSSDDILITAKRIKENNNNSPLASRINNQYINSTPKYDEPKTEIVIAKTTSANLKSSNSKPQNNKPVAKVTNNTDYHYGERVAISLKNGARWDGTIKEHSTDSDKVIVVLVDGKEVPTSKKDILKVELK